MIVDESGKVVLNSPETLASVKYAQELYKTFIPGTESWQDVNNNRAFLARQVSLTANGVSVYYAAKKDPSMADILEDMRSTNLPIGPVGKSIELHQTSTISIFKHTKFPEAAKAYLQFMYQAENMNAWIEGASAYCCQPLKEYASNPVWKSVPIHEAYARASETLRPNGFAGPLGTASAGVMADYVLVDMYATAVTGQMTAEDAIAQAEKRANRYYAT